MIKGVDLQILFGPGVPAPAPREIVDALQSANIQLNSGDVQNGFDMTFSVEKNSPLNTIFLIAGGTALPVLRVALVATMNGQTTSLINGVVTKTEFSPSSGKNPSTLKIFGKDLTALMKIIDFSGLIPYPAMPPFVRVNLILAKYAFLGVIPQVIPSAEGPPLPTDRIPRHQDKDYDYIQRLAEEAGYVFYMKPGPAAATSYAYWGPEVRIGEVQPALTGESGVATNVEELNFNFDKEGTALPIVYIQNALTKAPIPIPIPSSIPFRPPLGALPPLPPEIKHLKDTARLSPMEAIVRGLAYAARHSDAVSGSGTLDVLRYGRILKAYSLVAVRGASDAFDGTHYVQSVTHHISRGSYKQSFVLKRSGLLPTQAMVPV